MRKRKWPGSPLCSFCSQVETNNHLFFQCGVAKCAWGVMGKTIGANCCPNNVWQAMAWFHAFLPHGDRFHMVGFAAICWAIWKTRNRVTFEKYKLRSPAEIWFLASSLISYWAGLQKPQDKKILTEGAAKMRETATTLSRNQHAGAAETAMMVISSVLSSET